MLRKVLVSIFYIICLHSSYAMARDVFAGDWYSCRLDSDFRHDVIHIDRRGSDYEILREYGGSYSYSGHGVLKNNTLRFLGCSYFRDEAMDGCNPKQPTQQFNLKKSLLKRDVKNLEVSLKNSEWIQINKSTSFELVTGECERLSQQKYFDKYGWPKKF